MAERQCNLLKNGGSMSKYELIKHQTYTGVQFIELQTASVSTWLNESIINKYKSFMFIYNITANTRKFSGYTEFIPKEWFDINKSLNYPLAFDHNNVENSSLAAGAVKNMWIFDNYGISYFFGFRQLYSGETVSELTHHIYIYGIK